MKVIQAGVMVCLLGISTWGCNSGSRDGDPRYMGTTAYARSGSTAAPGSSGVLTIVAAHSDLVSGIANAPNSVIVFVNDPTLTSPVLTIDTGSGHVDSGAVSRTVNNVLIFTTTTAQSGAKYQVLGRKGGARVTSNEVTYGTFQNGTVDITEPVGDYTGVSNLIPAPGRATWTGVPQNQRSLILLRNPAGEIEWLATIPFSSYLWGDAFADTYRVGNNPLGSGRHRLTVLAVDTTGWATDGSDKTNGTGSTQQFSFEVQ